MQPLCGVGPLDRRYSEAGGATDVTDGLGVAAVAAPVMHAA